MLAVMPEALSPAEVAHSIGHRHEDGAEPAEGWHERAIEIIEAVLLAVVAVATAWSGYQTARWDGEQAHLYGRSEEKHALATQASARGGQEQLYDASVFSFWLQAKGRGDEQEAKLFEARFRPELRPAFEAWLATDPLKNPDAPPGPQLMPQYRNANVEKAEKLNAQASASYEEGTAARHRGDEYLRNTVLLATVLFLTALAQRFRILAVRAALLGVSAVLLAVGLYYLATYPTV
jgi:hypothetical protein